MKTVRAILLLVIFLTVFTKCRKDNYKACCTISKSTANIGDTIVFHNCSKRNSGYIESQLHLGDGAYISIQGDADIKHSYSALGQYTVLIEVGGIENGDDIEYKITIQ